MRPKPTHPDRLPLDLADSLLGQWRTPEEIDELKAQGEPYDAFLAFSMSGAEMDALIAQHRPQLEREARARNLPRPWARHLGPREITRWGRHVWDDYTADD